MPSDLLDSPRVFVAPSMNMAIPIRESQSQFENQIMPWVYIRSMHSTMYQKASFR